MAVMCTTLTSCDKDERLPEFRNSEEFAKHFQPTSCLDISEYYNTEWEFVGFILHNSSEWGNGGYYPDHRFRIVETSDGIKLVPTYGEQARFRDEHIEDKMVFYYFGDEEFGFYPVDKNTIISRSMYSERYVKYKRIN